MRPHTCGFYGKLPAFGDFIQRGLPRDFVKCWDHWVSELVMVSSKDAAWLQRRGPSWSCRFMLGHGLCGDVSVVGAFAPSRDIAGRDFPFMVAILGLPMQCGEQAADAFAKMLNNVSEEPVELDALKTRFEEVSDGLAPCDFSPSSAFRPDSRDSVWWIPSERKQMVLRAAGWPLAEEMLTFLDAKVGNGSELTRP